MKYIVYRDRKKEWRWKIQGRNGKIECSSGEGYKRRAGALRFYNKLQTLCADGRIDSIKLVEKTKK